MPEKKEKDYKYVILIFQAIVFLLLIGAGVIIKLVGGGFYGQVKDEYVEYFCDETRLSDMLSPPPEESNFDFGYSVRTE